MLRKQVIVARNMAGMKSRSAIYGNLYVSTLHICGKVYPNFLSSRDQHRSSETKSSLPRRKQSRTEATPPFLDIWYKIRSRAVYVCRNLSDFNTPEQCCAR